MSRPRPTDAGRAVFETWVRAHHAAVFQSAWRITRSRADADDVAQQVFLRLLESPEALADPAEPERALRWLAVKTALTFRRGEANRRRREKAHAMVHPELDPRRDDDDVARRELLVAVRAGVAALPEELRLATVLRFQEGLTFAAMAELAGVSEPTMFERVKRALEKLRSALTAAGHAGFAVELESLLAVPEVAAVPPQLCATLLALAPGGGAVAAAAVATSAPVVNWLAAAAAVALVGGGALTVRLWRPHHLDGAAPAVVHSPSPSAKRADPTPPVAAAAAPIADREIEPPPAFAQPASPTAVRARDLLFTQFGLEPESPWDEALVETGRLRGVVVDDDGRTLPHAAVVAFSTDGAPKAFQWRARQETADDGSFELRVATAVSAPQRYFIDLADPDMLPLRVDARVREHETTDLGRIVLQRNTADRAGAWSLRLTLLAPDGTPIQGAGVRLHRKFVAKGSAQDPPPREEFETGGVTDEFGNVELAGTRIGAKTLQIYARFLGWRDSSRDFTIDVGGASERRLTVERGLTLHGRLALPAGCVGARLDAVPMAGGEPFDGAVADDGTFDLRGLDPGRYRLRIDGDFSSAWLDDVEAGRDDIVIELKRRDDARDVGVHRAELHGRIVATAGGAPVRVDPGSTRALALPEGWSPDDPRVFTELVPAALAPQIAQVLCDDSPPPAPSSDFHVTGLDAGSYVFLVHAKGYAPGVSRVVTLKEREVAAGLVVSLETSE